VTQGNGARCNASRPDDNAAVMSGGKTGKTTKGSDRSRRLAAELRENLRRRKAQERNRNAPATQQGAGQPATPGGGKQNA